MDEASVWIQHLNDLRWPNTWEMMMRWCQPLRGLQRKPTLRQYTELNKFCHKLNILSFYNIWIYCRNLISCKALQRLYRKKRYTNNLESNWNVFNYCVVSTSIMICARILLGSFVCVCVSWCCILSHLAPTDSPQLDKIHPLKRPINPAVC